MTTDYEKGSNDANDKINNVSNIGATDTSKDNNITKNKLPLPSHKSPRRTKYMMHLERMRIRQMLLDGYTEDMIAHKLQIGTRQVQKYIQKIRQIDHQTLMEQDELARSHMVQMTIDHIKRLKMQMLEIVYDEKSMTKDKIVSAEKARDYMLDIVNLTLNGPLALSIKRNDNSKQPVISKYIKETTEDRGDNTVFS